MNQYWSVEECRWVPCPPVEQAADDPVVPAQRDADEPVAVPELATQS